MKLLVTFAAFVAIILHASAQKMQTPAGEAPGPWLLGTIGVGKQPDGTMKTTALKGLAIKVGERGEAAVCYDLDLCRMAGAWTGGKFTTPMNLMSRGEYPTALGDVAFITGEVPGFVCGNETTKDTKSAKAEDSSSDLRALGALRGFKDTRPEPFGPLPSGGARFRGFYVNGDKTILKWEIAGTEVLEMPTQQSRNGFTWVERVLNVAAHPAPIRINVLSFSEPRQKGRSRGGTTGDALDGYVLNSVEEVFFFGKEAVAVDLEHVLECLSVTGLEIFGSAELETTDAVVVVLPPATVPTRIRIGVWRGATEHVDKFSAALGENMKPRVWFIPDLTTLKSGGPTRWPDTVVTDGEVAVSKEDAYVVDSVKLPEPNPWGAPMFIGGFDFFRDGRAGSPMDRPPLVPGAATSAVCTFHGDVFLVSGIDEKLEHVTWKRFASGLYHALGLKIVNGEIYVTCRDGIWRLKDLNGDGECDFYEAFNFDVKVTKSFHEFVFDLQTDPAGNFYFAKAGPVKNGGRGFDEIMEHHGSLFRVSPDGAKFERIATGFRAPNGIGVGPHGELTSGDNEGTWTPACKINWIKPGGFYGVVDLSHRTPPPTSYDPPLCWLPKRVDNSGGGQVWVPDDDRWGPWRGQLLHLSYGQSALYGVLMEQIQNSVTQGGVVKFPLQFQSGIMRARFNPKDGQLYVAGLRGWQTNGLKNGCFQRVRYTGAVPRMPLEMHVKKDGIELRFACSLDTQSARDPENWHLEQWRYLWSSAYGSPELSAEGEDAQPAELGKDGKAQFTAAHMQKAKHDPVIVKSVAIGTDDRSVFLEIPGLKPVMQMSIKYDLKTADGDELRGEVVNTIHALGAE